MKSENMSGHFVKGFIMDLGTLEISELNKVKRLKKYCGEK